ncbi:MAG: cation transporter [Pseudonocardiales bacterium]|nr:cation transporter [Pseudonocardiales bacterium]
MADEQDRAWVSAPGPVQVNRGFFGTGLRWPPHSGRSASAITVLLALGVNVVVAGVKSVVAALTGSASLAAEAAHSWADTGNGVFLVVATRRSARPPDRAHPLGYGREAYVWSLFAALGLFVTGGAVSISNGVTELRAPTPAEHFVVGYAVLVVCFALEATSLLRSVHQARPEAQALASACRNRLFSICPGSA